MPRRYAHPSQCYPDFWMCPFCGGHNLTRVGAYRLSAARLFRCAGCKQHVSESALGVASAKRRQMAAQAPQDRRWRV
jgi:transposase-like protein